MKIVSRLLAAVFLTVSVFGTSIISKAEENTTEPVVPTEAVTESVIPTEAVTETPSDVPTATPVATPAPLVMNGDFELGNTGWEFLNQEADSGIAENIGNNNSKGLRVAAGDSIINTAKIPVTEAGGTYLLKADVSLISASTDVSKALTIKVVGRGDGKMVIATPVVTAVPTETVTEAPTEAVTEIPAETTTEAVSEQPTEAVTGEVTETATEALTEVPTEVPTIDPALLGDQIIQPNSENVLTINASSFKQNNEFVTIEKKITLSQLQELVGPVTGEAFTNPYFELHIIVNGGTYVIDNISLTKAETVVTPGPVPVPVKNFKVTYTTTASRLNVRTSSSTKSKSVGTLKKDTVLVYKGTVGSWYKISYKGKIRYVSRTYVKVKSTWYVIAKTKVYTRSGPGTSYKKNGQLVKNAKVTLSQKYRGFGKISGKSIWVNLSYLKQNTAIKVKYA